MNNINNLEKIIMGIDPGTNNMGYAIIAEKNKKRIVLISGTLRLFKLKNTYLKYKHIFQRTLQIIDEYKPDELAIESQFLSKNIQSTLKLGRAQGIAISAALQRDIPVFEYTPRKIKLAVTGNGSASKIQIEYFVKKHINLTTKNPTFDETDALAIALCHLFQKNQYLTSAGKETTWKAYIKNNPDKIAKQSRDGEI